MKKQIKKTNNASKTRTKLRNDTGRPWISSPVKKCSIVCFNPTNNDYDLINSIAHEAVHVMEAILSYYDVNIKGEPPAYTIGHLVQIMLEPLKLI